MYYRPFLDCNYGTIIRTGIACKKISCYMCNSACRWLIVENDKNFKVMLKIFEFSHKKEILESWLVYVNIVSSNHVSWLNWDNKKNLVPASFSYVVELFREKNKF